MPGTHRLVVVFTTCQQRACGWLHLWLLTETSRSDMNSITVSWCYCGSQPLSEQSGQHCQHIWYLIFFQTFFFIVKFFKTYSETKKYCCVSAACKIAGAKLFCYLLKSKKTRCLGVKHLKLEQISRWMYSWDVRVEKPWKFVNSKDFSYQVEWGKICWTWISGKVLNLSKTWIRSIMS